MKRLLFLILILFPLILFSQDKLSRVPLEMRHRPWLDKQEHHLFGHTVMQVFGNEPLVYKHSNVGQFTTIAYQNLEQILDKTDSIGRAEKWDPEKLEEQKAHYRQHARGGRLLIFISRYNESDANTKWYFVMLRDMDEQTFFEQNLRYQSPQTPEGLGWWNWYELLIDVQAECPFYVYLNQNVTEHLSDYKFLIKKNNPE